MQMLEPRTALDKELALIDWMRSHGSVLIGFSGGVDSAYLACVALDALGAEHVLAVIGRSASYPMEQWTRAREVADQFGIPVTNSTPTRSMIRATRQTRRIAAISAKRNSGRGSCRWRVSAGSRW